MGKGNIAMCALTQGEMKGLKGLYQRRLEGTHENRLELDNEIRGIVCGSGKGESGSRIITISRNM